MPKNNPVEQLADAFKTEAMKSAWPVVSKIFEKAGINTKKYDALFDKKASVTAMSEAGNQKLLELSQEISDAVLKEFTSPALADEVAAQTQHIRIKSSLRTQLEAVRKGIEEAGTKNLSTEERLKMAGLQSFYEQMENIDVTSVLKAQKVIEKERAIEQAKKAQPAGKLSAVQSNQARVALNDFAAKAQKAPANKLGELAAAAAATLAKHGIKEGHLEGLFGALEPYAPSNANSKKLRDAITQAVQAASH